MKKIYRFVFVILLMAFVFPSFSQQRERRRPGRESELRKSSHEPSTSEKKTFTTQRLNAGKANTQLFSAETPPANYYVSTPEEPWGSESNNDAMDNAFGSGNWVRMNFTDAGITSIFNASTKFIFLEGSDDNANELNTFLAGNLPTIEAWVAAGGRLLLNAAPNEGGNINFGFDETLLNYNNAQDEVTVVDALKTQPFVLTASVYRGNSFSHSHVTGTDLMPLILGGDKIVLAEKLHGDGVVYFGGMTTSNYHSPQPDADHLRANILYHIAFNSAEPQAPLAQFIVSDATTLVGRKISLTDISAYYPTNRTWTITPSHVVYLEGTNANSSNPKIRFTQPGSYTVSLTVSNGLGQDTRVKENYITVSVPDNYFWVGGSGSWNDYANHWATSSGGTEFHTRIPGIDDNVFFDANSFTEEGQVVDLDNDELEVYNLNFQGAAFHPEITNGYLSVSGSLNVPNAVTFSLESIGLTSPDAATINIREADFIDDAGLWIYGQGTFNFVSPVEADYLEIDGGTVNLNGHKVTVNSFYVEDELITVINFAGSQLHVKEYFEVYANNENALTGPYKIFLGAEGTNAYLEGEPLKLADVTLAGVVRFDDAIAFGKLAITPGTTLNLNGYVHSVESLEMNGTADQNITIANGTFSKASGTEVGTYLRLTNVVATGGASFYADKNSIDNGGNTGWIFSTKDMQTVTIEPVVNKTFGNAPFNLAATSTSGLPVTLEIVSGPVTLSGNTATITGAGLVMVKATQAGNDSYLPAEEVQQSFSIAKATQTLTFTIADNLVFGQAPVTLTATPGETGNPVTFQVANGPATITDNVLTIIGAGELTINATQAGTANFEAAMATKTVNVAKATQTIVFDDVTPKTIGDASFDLSATGGGSGNAVTFIVVSGPATISGKTVTLTGAGSVAIKASQAGNLNYHAAADIEQSFCVNPAKPVITVSGLDTEAPVLTSSSNESNQWYRNGTVIPDATEKTYTVSDAGTYTVVASAGTCFSAASDGQVLIITGVEGTLDSRVSTYPNPVAKELVVDLTGLNARQDATVSLYDMSGKLMTSAKAKSTLKLSMENYRPGQYAVVIRIGTQQISKHIIKK